MHSRKPARLRGGAGAQLPSHSSIQLPSLLEEQAGSGDAPVDVEGYPEVVVRDDAGEDLEVDVGHGTTMDLGPVPLVLSPGERALSIVEWRLLVLDGDPEVGASLEVRPVVEAEAQAFPVHVDLGTTGAITVTAWTLVAPEGWSPFSSVAPEP